LADPADVNINPSFEIEKFGPVQAGTFDTVALANLPETLGIDRFDHSLRFQRKAVRPKKSERVPSCADQGFAIYKLLKFMGKFLESSHWRIDHSLWRSATISTKLEMKMSWWKKILWVVVSALGVWAMARLALFRGEQISALWIVLAGFCALSISYRFYSKWLATKVLMLNEERATP